MLNLVKIFKALSDETRIRILKVLMERECCVCEIIQALDISGTRASRNLGILEDAGFITSRRDRLWVVYSINEQNVNSNIVSLIQMIRSSLLSENKILQDRERLNHAERIIPSAVNR